MPFLLMRLRRWLLVIVLAPLLGAAAQRASRELARRNGPSRLTDGLDRVGSTLRRRGRRRR